MISKPTIGLIYPFNFLFVIVCKSGDLFEDFFCEFVSFRKCQFKYYSLNQQIPGVHGNHLLDANQSGLDFVLNSNPTPDNHNQIAD